jgi:hypothetical protein
MYEDKKRKGRTRGRKREIIIDGDNKKLKEVVVIYV